MSDHNLLSKEWCDLIFEGRNKDYGAYQIRKNIGKRYLVALCSVFLLVFVAIGMLLGIRLFMKDQMLHMMEDWEKHIPRMKMAEVEMGHEIKTIAGSRPRPHLPIVKDGTTQVPEIVEVTKNEIRFGVETLSEESFEGSDFQSEMEESLEELDSIYDQKRQDLPLGESPLQSTETVEQMPQFPGGIRALMKWLDEHIVYPQRCIRMKIGGELQVTFLVGEDGRLSNVKIISPLHPELDRAVLNAIRRMPCWEPGMVDGKPAVVGVTLPVNFQPR